MEVVEVISIGEVCNILLEVEDFDLIVMDLMLLDVVGFEGIK